MKKRILIITPFLMQGGVEHSLITALSGIDYEHYEITLYIYKEDLSLLPYVPNEVHVIKGFDKTHYYRKPKAVLLLSLSKIMSVLRLSKQEKKLTNKLYSYIHTCKVNHPKKRFFKDSRFDVIISYCLHLGTEMAVTLNAKKHYLFLHNSHVDYHEDIFLRCKSEYDAFFCVSQGVKNVYKEAFSVLSNKFFLIDNYVDALEVINKAKSYTINKRNDSKYVLCTCGRLALEKGFDLAVNAATILKDLGYSFYWYYVGDGYHRKTIEDLIQLNHLDCLIEITGYKDNPYPYIQSCDIYVQPSYEESQGLAIYEALVLGKAVVSTDTIGARCTLDNGNKGILTEFSAEGLADGIKRLIDDETLRRSYENCITVEDNLSRKHKYYEEWKKILDGGF